MEPFSTRYRLTKRRQGDRVSGEVYLTITVLPKWIFDVVHFSEDSSTLLDPQMLQVRESTGEMGGGMGAAAPVVYRRVRDTDVVARKWKM